MIQRLVKLKFILLFLLIAQIIIIILLSYNESHDNKMFLENRTQLAKIEYETIYWKIEEQSSMIFSEQINTDEIINIFKSAHHSTKDKKKLIRKKLYKKLLPSYQRLQKSINLKQLHFHLPNKQSFLRMHRPEKFGDDLSGIRQTVEYVNQYKTAVSGFEEGRIYNGFRFVYPLFDKKNNFIGSVEVSFSALSFQNTLSDDIRFSQFLFLKELAEEKVWREEYDINYIESEISPKFLVESTWKNDRFAPFKRKIKENLTQEIKNIFEKKLISKEAYSISLKIDSTPVILSFLPIKNPITENIAAYLVIISKSDYLNHRTFENLLIKIISFALLFTLFILIYRQTKYTEDIQSQHNLLLQQSKMAQMGSMLSNVAHQWKQPLARINSKLIEIPISLSLNHKDRENLESNLEVIEDYTLHMAQTLESFRRYFQPNKLRNYFNLNQTIDKAIYILGLKENLGNIKLNLHVENNIRIHCYEDELIQTLIILLLNAKEAFEGKDIKDAFIEINVIDKVKQIDILIIDNAGGINEEIIKHIFNPYFTTKENGTNDGVGLYMAKMIIEGSMQGKLSYKREQNSSCFTISLEGLKE